jgi:hypothetical protein
MKENFCQVWPKNHGETSSLVEKSLTSCNQKTYVIGSEKYLCPEILFQPQIIGYQHGKFYFSFNS